MQLKGFSKLINIIQKRREKRTQKIPEQTTVIKVNKNE